MSMIQNTENYENENYGVKIAGSRLYSNFSQSSERDSNIDLNDLYYAHKRNMLEAPRYRVPGLRHFMI